LIDESLSQRGQTASGEYILYCRMRGCGGRVHVIEANRHFHICIVPLCLLDTTNLVQCQRCTTTITLPAHMGTCVRAKQPIIPMAKGQLVHLPVATPMSVEMGVHDESRPILWKKATRKDCPFQRKRNHKDETTGSKQQAPILSREETRRLLIILCTTFNSYHIQ
jgi:hypothetical protein